MNEIRIYKNPWKALKLIAMSSPFVAIGIWIIDKDNSTYMELFMGPLITIFSALGIFIGLFHLFDRRPQIIITKDGIWDRTLKLDLIKWEMIKYTYEFGINGQKFISLKLDKDVEGKVKQYKWATKLSKMTGAQKVNLNLGQLKINTTELKKFITEMKESSPTDRTNKIQIVREKWS